MVKVFLVVLAFVVGEPTERHEFPAPSAEECADIVTQLTERETMHTHPGGSQVLYGCRVDFVGEPA